MSVESSKPISAWPGRDRPRERILSEGGGALSDSELLALVLRSGVRGKDAVVLARELLAQFKGLRGLFEAEKTQLLSVSGLGPAKACALMAVNEIFGRRLREETVGRKYIRDAGAVIDVLRAGLRDRKREFFRILFLDKGNRILDEKDLFRGTVDEAAVYTREIVKAALDSHATGLVLAHNHPSGRTQPSREDVEITRKIRSAADTVGIRVLDHIIVGEEGYFSFCEHGLLGGAGDRA